MDTKISSTPSGSGHGSTRQLPLARHFTRRRAWCYLSLWLILVAIIAWPAYEFSNRIQSTLSGVNGSAPEVVKLNLIKNFSSALAFPTALVWDAKGVPQAQADAAWTALLDKVKGDHPMVQEVTDGKTMIDNWPRLDWYAAFVAVDAKTYGEAQTTIPRLRADVRTLTYPNGKLPWVTGGPALFLDLNTASTEALRTGELIALPVTFLILLLVFRSIVAALLPVIVATLGVVCTLGILSYLAGNYPSLGWHGMSVTFFVPNLVTMIGLGVGIDYCLIYLARYRRERSLHLTTQEALQVTRATAGRTVLASAVLVMSGFLTLLFIPLDFFTSIALGGMLVVVVVMLATLTLLPAMIFLVGRYLEWGRISLAPLHSFRVKASFGERWIQMLLKHPRICLVAGLLLLGLLSIPAYMLRIGAPEARNLPKQSDARQGYESLTQNLGSGWMMPAIVLVEHTSPDWIVNDVASETGMVKQFNELPNTEKTLTVTDTSGPRRIQQSRMGMLTPGPDRDPNQSVMLLLSKSDPQSPAARTWLVQIAQILSAAQIGNPGGSKYFLGGLPAVTFSADNVIIKTLPKVILVTLCSTFLLLILFMRSLLVAIKAIVLNLLCVLAAYGFQVICFQEGWGSRLFGLYPTDGLNTVVLVICFCALFGLSMDYEVFILSAVRESWLDSHSMRLSVQDGFLRVAGIITSAAIIMVSVFLSFAFGDVVEIEQLGVGLSFAVLLDATVIRLFLVPCIMLLMGRWAFWLPGQPAPLAEKHFHHQQQAIRRETSRITPHIPD